MKLIKFTGYHDHLIGNIRDCKLKFNNITNFNDPFEGIFRYQVSTDKDKFLSFYLNEYGGRPDKADYYFHHLEEFNAMLNKTHNWRYENNAVTCFSAYSNHSNVIMWSHYCKVDWESHNGVCLVFDSTKLRFIAENRVLPGNIGVAEVTGPPLKINYVKRYLSEDPLDKELTPQTFIGTKFAPWAYEKEYRYVAARADRYYYPKEALKEIIFGLRLPQDKRDEIIQMVKSVHPHVKLSEVVLKKSDFGFIKKAVN